jgi:predicted RNA binding protein YcfA (HicA-like mRNA interferase family)
MTSREVVKLLKQNGATFVRQVGSHAFYVSACGNCRTTVPMHPGDIRPGTLRAIEKQMADCYGKGWLR